MSSVFKYINDGLLKNFEMDIFRDCTRTTLHCIQLHQSDNGMIQILLAITYHAVKKKSTQMLSIFVKCICKEVNNPMNGCVSSQTGALRVDPALLHDG